MKASPQAKGEKLGFGKERQSFLEFVSRHRNHLYPEKSSFLSVGDWNGCSGSIDRVCLFLFFLNCTVSNMGNDQIGHPSVSTLKCLAKSPGHRLIVRAERQLIHHDSQF